MTDRDIVLHFAMGRGLTVLKPTKACREIVIYDYATGFGICVAEAGTWKEARKQLEARFCALP